jgi:hypothetical protein
MKEEIVMSAFNETIALTDNRVSLFLTVSGHPPDG